ncbi:MAG: hypothetical protein ACQPRI_06605 [Solitalea-like symbiont of Tyrophagus putrescentiae]
MDCDCGLRSINLIFYLNDVAIIVQYGWSIRDVPPNVFPSQKLLPANLRNQADIFFNIVVLISTGTGFCFLFHKMEPFERHFRMLALIHKDGTLKAMYQDGQLLDTFEAQQIFKLHKKAKVIIEVLFLVVIAEAQPFYLFNVFNNWEGAFQDYFTAIWIIVSIEHLVMSE